MKKKNIFIFKMRYLPIAGGTCDSEAYDFAYKVNDKLCEKYLCFIFSKQTF